MSQLISFVSWSVLVLFLSLTTFSLNLILFLINCFVISIFAIYFSLKQYLNHLKFVPTPVFHLNLISTNRINQKLKKSKIYFKKPEHQPEFLTGNVLIDEHLKDIIDLLFRDVIIPWYCHISPKTYFLHDLKIFIYIVVRNLASRVYQIDRVNYLTTQLIDDFASHLRLYRSAEQRLRILKKDDANANLFSIFFDLELQMEKNKLCRDLVSEDNDSCQQYLKYICDILQYLLLPVDAFDNRLIRNTLSHILVHSIFYPLFEIFSNPDFINQMLIWLCKFKTSYASMTEEFLNVLRCCDNKDELNSVNEIVIREISIYRSKDIGGDNDFEIKQQLNGLLFVQSVIKTRFKCLDEGSYVDLDSNGLPVSANFKKLISFNAKLFQIPFDVILKNNIALSYFIEYMSSIGYQGYIYFYLNVEGFKLSTQQQLTMKKGVLDKNCSNLINLREAAINIFENYLSVNSKRSYKIKVEKSIIREIEARIKNEFLSEDWFDKAHETIFEIMYKDENFYPSFKKSIHYIKLLAELDLLKNFDNNINNNHLQPKFDKSSDLHTQKQLNYKNKNILDSKKTNKHLFSNELKTFNNFSNHQNLFDFIRAEINGTGVVREFGNSYGVYCITVWKKNPKTEKEEEWCILRRYSDFDSFHQSILEKFQNEIKNKINFSSKRPFRNISQEFLEQRKHFLNSYLQQVIQLASKLANPSLNEAIMKFIEPQIYEKEKESQLFTKTVNNLVVNPLKSSVKTVGNVMKASSNNLKDGLQKLSKLGSLNSKSSNFVTSSALNQFKKKPTFMNYSSISSSSSNSLLPEINNDKVCAALDVENDIDNIPLRIMLLLMDEVFDLKNTNLWLRKRLINVVRQVIKATFGDTINRKIVEYVEDVTSSAALSEYLNSIKTYFWPNNQKLVINDRNERDLNKKMRTRVATKVLLLSTLSDDFKHIIGNETTRKGLMCVFQMFQNETLNRRLILVFFESLLIQLFPDNHLQDIFQKVHSSSHRVRNVQKIHGNKF